MRVKNHKLVGADGRNVPFLQTPNGGDPLTGDKPRFLVIHYTAGGSLSGAVEWFRNPDAKASAHLNIGQDGAIVQMQTFDKICWHAGKSRWRNVKGLNSHSVGIEVVNWGLLKKSGSGGWLSHTNKPVPNDRVIMAPHKNSPGADQGWEAFEHEQYMATVAAAQALVAEYGILPGDLVGHDDISPLRKVDPGPAWDMEKFRALVFGRDQDEWDDLLYKVNSNTGLNMRSGPGTEHEIIKNLADGTVVHVIENVGNWWLVAEVVDGDDDVTGYVHRHWLQPK
ncbi:MAG: N-acetylmuramoyl-L-alanine amidase [Pseudomonadota bacterium]